MDRQRLLLCLSFFSESSQPFAAGRQTLNNIFRRFFTDSSPFFRELLYNGGVYPVRTAAQGRGERKPTAMKILKRVLPIVLAVCLLASLGAVSAIDAGETRTVIGADLTDDQIKTVYKTFGIERGSVKERPSRIRTSGNTSAVSSATRRSARNPSPASPSRCLPTEKA